ncbi:MAG: hypothetical protein QF790_01960 [Gammaproteobacteria bacterium]|jgi:hypothetical protein|nr:hypothetical protein [Gammaproteobacteria bacterium]MDP6615914.1 hypothetical protein [Gammaproteobacteria bacterium]MDP6695047.1 hypothetical protein [Gammaproteobacteria bacterium]
MGFLDIPAPVFSAIDGALGILPAYLRLILWAVVTAVISMFLYWLCSAQDKVGRAKERAVTARKNMAAYDGHEFDEMWPLAKESLAASGKHFVIVLGPALLSSVPALMLIIWVSNHYSYALPEAGTTIALEATPGNSLALTQIEWPDADKPVDVQDNDAKTLLTLPLAAAVPVIHKKAWWNSLIGNPNGYLDETASADEVRFDLPRLTYLDFGPGWTRTWELSYFLMLIICSLGIKVAFRIH